jgi:allantoin racemase
MKILTLNPNTSESMTAEIAAAARAAAAPGTEIVAARPRFGAEAIDSAAESYLSAVVLDIAECAAHVAHLIGRRFTVVTTLARSTPAIEDRLTLAGLTAHCASVRACGLGTAEVDADPAAAVRAIVDEAARAVAEDGADVICLGCAGMAGVTEEISAKLGVPAVDGVAAAVALAQALVGLGMTTSKVGALAEGPPNPRTHWPISTALGLTS